MYCTLLFKVISTSSDSVTFVWLEPLGLDRSCDTQNAFRQYADVATSSHNGVRWSPQEATGIQSANKRVVQREVILFQGRQL